MNTNLAKSDWGILLRIVYIIYFYLIVGYKGYSEESNTFHHIH